ncbi:hypothetical protein C4565_10695 [Candidatus Parcubacteria bacterium]|jgi:RNase P subunit RPR2|nr:MAG: hypothetical protein C4565_10695 [Candidatus Parcubacteria bacterium]
MKNAGKQKKKVVAPHTYYRSFMCGTCKHISKKANVLWEQFASENCILVRVECPKCGHQEVPFLDKKRYMENIINGEYFKNTLR